jgi:hypothetical protein
VNKSKNTKVMATFNVHFICALDRENGPIRPTRRSASDVLEAALGLGSGELPKGLYFDRTQPLETSAKSRDGQKRNFLWIETARYA